MKQGPAENMTVAVLNELLKDKEIAFSSKAKKSEASCVKVRVLVATLPCTAAAYDGSIPKFKLFFLLNKQLPHLAS